MDFQLNLETETVEHAQPAPAVCVEGSASVREVIGVLQQHRTGAVVICENQRPCGIFTERDVLRLLADNSPLDVPVSRVMAQDPVTLFPDDTVGKAIELMATGGFRRLPVVDRQGRITGNVKVSGILRYLTAHFPNVVYTLPPEPHHKPLEREGA